MSRDLYQVHPTRQEIQQSWQELETTGRDNIIQDLDMPWYTKPAVILGKLYPEISIKKIYSEETLPPYLPKGSYPISSQTYFINYFVYLILIKPPALRTEFLRVGNVNSTVKVLFKRLNYLILILITIDNSVRNMIMI